MSFLPIYRVHYTYLQLIQLTIKIEIPHVLPEHLRINIILSNNGCYLLHMSMSSTPFRMTNIIGVGKVAANIYIL